MINQRHCPFCRQPAADGCAHLALAAEGRDFVRCCVETSHAQRPWESLLQLRRRRREATGEWSPEQDDFTWLEAAFAQEFLRHLRWFGGMEHEWRSGPRAGQGGFWVILWSPEPRRLWWELRDEIERHSMQYLVYAPQPPALSLRQWFR